MKYVLPPLDDILHVINPTKEQRVQQHARRLQIALDQCDVREAILELNLMMRLYHEIRNQTSDT